MTPLSRLVVAVLRARQAHYGARPACLTPDAIELDSPSWFF
jgi:hypothetical protein